MALGPKLTLKQNQRLALTPSMRQNLEFLALSTAGVEQALQQASEENPFLVLRERRNDYASGRAFAAATRTIAQPQSLADGLKRQLVVMRLPEQVAALAGYLTGDLDERGYLSTSPQDLSTDLAVPLLLIEQAIAALQACEPTGVGARDLKDCLRLQLRETGLPPAKIAALLLALEPIAEEDWNAASAQSGIDGDELRRLAKLLSTLNPNPVAALDAAPAVPLIPELRVERISEAAFRVSLIGETFPELTLDTGLLSKSVQSPDARDFAERCRSDVEALITALRFRGQTLLRVGNALVEHHVSYFQGDKPTPDPLSRQDLGATLGLHGTTIGRAIVGKSMEWDGQVIALDWFFPRALPATEAGWHSVPDVQKSILRLLSAETADQVLSDAAIATMLRHEGVDIARRTVAKYRKCLSIPPSNLRRRHLARAAKPVAAKSGRASYLD